MKNDQLNVTLAVIKPDAIKWKMVGKIMTLIEKSGFKIMKMKTIEWMPEELVKEFYKVHKNEYFFNNLVNGMKNKQWIFLVLKHDNNAISVWRKTMKFIRKNYTYRTAPHENAVHGSDSVRAFIYEYKTIFKKS